MSRTASNMLALEQKHWVLLKKTWSREQNLSFADLKGKRNIGYVYLQSLSFVLHVIEEVVIANDYRVQGLGVIAISSNDVVNFRRTPQIDDGVCFWKQHSYLYDETQQ
jgi:hypothetical protein